MADLKRCDRCKTIFDHMRSEDIKLPNGRKKVVYPRMMQMVKYTDDAQYNRVADIFDLCPTCTMGLVKFLHIIDEDGSES